MWARTNDGPGVASRDPRRFAVPLLPLAAALLIPACFHAPPTAPATATSIELVSGSGQSGTPGYRLDNEVTVRVRDDAGHPMAGVVVTFSPDDQFAYAEPATDTTDSDGVARTAWRLGAFLGEQHLSAGLAGTAMESVRAGATASSGTVKAISGGFLAWCMVSNAGVLSCTVPPSLNTPNPPFPGTVVAPGTEFTEVSTGAVEQRACAITKAGRVLCFTSAGTGAFMDVAELPGVYPPLHGLTSGSNSPNDTYCALAVDGVGYCWGSNYDGQLGVGDLVDRSAPTPMATDQRFQQVAVQTTNACGLTLTGDAFCWGDNFHGQTGAPAGGRTVVPTRVNTTEKFREVGLIWTPTVSCGVRISGGLWCWGEGLGPVPQAIINADNVIGIRMVRYLTVLQSRTGVELIAGNASSDNYIWPWPVAAVNGRVLRDYQSPHSRDLVCGTARSAIATLCQTTNSMYSDAAGYPAPGVGIGDRYRTPPVIGIPMR